MPGCLHPALRQLPGVALITVLLAGCGGAAHRTMPGPQPGPSIQRATPLETIFEAGGALIKHPKPTLDALRALGVDRVRVFVSWGALSPHRTDRTEPPGFDPTSPDSYRTPQWQTYDRIIRAAAARGIGVDLTIGGPAPVWAQGGTEPPGGVAGVWRPDAALFGALVGVIGRRYSGSYTPAGTLRPLPRVTFWSIWNEPNYGSDLAPQATQHSAIEVSPALYRSLLDAAWSALHATGHGSDTILIGELAPRGLTVGDQPGNFSGMVPVRFLRALYCVDAAGSPLRGSAASLRGCPASDAGSAAFARIHPGLFDAAGFALHPYPQDLPPDQLDPTPDAPLYADLPRLSAVEALLDSLQMRYGARGRMPVYSTEYGYQTDPPEKIYPTTPEQAAAYLNWAEYLSWRDPRMRSYDQYLLSDTARANAAGGFATGLEFKNGTPKPAYAAFRLPIFLPVTSGAKTTALELWGCVRPARYARQDTGRPQSVEVQFQPSTGAGVWRTLRAVTVTDPYGYFDVRQTFPGPGTVRLSWTYPHGPRIYSRLVDLSLR